MYICDVQLARHSKQCIWLFILMLLVWLQGWVGRHIKTLLDVFLLSSNLAIWLIVKKKRQRERPLMMTIRSSTSSYRRGVVLHIILTWASCSCLSFTIGSQGQMMGWAKVWLPRLFLYPFGSGGHRTQYTRTFAIWIKLAILRHWWKTNFLKP